MNKVNLVGNVVRDPELINDKVCKYTLAVKRTYQNDKGEYESDFIKCTSFKGQAKTIKAYVKKGDKLAVSGSIQTGSYINKNNQKVYTTEVIADQVEFLTPKRQEPITSETPNQELNNPYEEFGDMNYSTDVENQFGISESDLPF